MNTKRVCPLKLLLKNTKFQNLVFYQSNNYAKKLSYVNYKKLKDKILKYKMKLQIYEDLQ